MAIQEVLMWNPQLWAQQRFCRGAAFILFRCGQHRAPTCQALCPSTKKQNCYQATCLHSAWRLMAGGRQRGGRNSRQRDLWSADRKAACHKAPRRGRDSAGTAGGCVQKSSLSKGRGQDTTDMEPLNVRLWGLDFHPSTKLPNSSTYLPTERGSCAQSYPTLCDSSVRGILQARTLERVAMGILPGPEIEPLSPVSPALQPDSLPAEPLAKS